MGDNHEEESSGITSSDIETIISDQIHSIFISREAADGISDSLITVQEHKKLVTLLHDETNGKIFEKIENKTVLTATSTSIHERKEHSGEPPLDTLGVQVNLLNTVEVQVEPLDTSGGELVEDSDVNNGQEVLDDEPKSIIVSLLKQLRLNADLHRVTLPTFILEPRSLLERITDFMSFPQLILHSPFYEDPLERFKAVLRYFLSAWHIRPKGVKKPYNPVLGEFFRCQWHVPRPSAEFMEEVANKMAPDSCLFGHPHSDSDLTCRQHLATEILLKDQEFRSSAHGLERDLVANFGCPYCRVSGQSSSYYVAEQVSHHPPVSAYFYTNPSHHLVIQGNFRPGSKFLGNSAVSFMRGATQIHFTNRPGEVYSLTNPNYYIRGLFLGTMLTELGDHVKIECNKTGFFADIEFKTKGFFTGSYNCLSGKIKKNVNGKETTLYTLSGKWTDIIYLTDCVTGLKEEFLNIQDLMSAQTFTKSHGTSFEGPNEDSHAQSSRQALHKKVPPMSAQSFYESRQLWLDVTQSLEKKDYEAATTYKSMIEEDQRLRKVNSPIFMEKEDFDQLVSFDGIDPTPIIKPDSLSSDNITAEKIYYKVLVDPHSEVPLMTRYFQSNDGIHWRFKYFLPPSIIPESVSMSSPSLISFGGLFKTPSILSSKDSRNADSITSTNSIPGVTLPHSSYSERELTELLQRLFCSDARDDYMDRTYYLSVK